jgi:pimeloyl-ACP methyl ester carboxylesterase
MGRGAQLLPQPLQVTANFIPPCSVCIILLPFHPCCCAPSDTQSHTTRVLLSARNTPTCGLHMFTAPRSHTIPTVDEVASAVVEALQAAGIKRVGVVAHSYGVHTAQTHLACTAMLCTHTSTHTHMYHFAQ